MFRIIPDLLQALISGLPHWALAPLAFVALLIALPLWFRSVRAKQVRGKLRQIARAKTETERQRLEDMAFHLAGQKERLLLLLLEEGHRLNQGPVWRRAQRLLKTHGLASSALALFERALKPKAHRITHPIEAVVKIEGLWRSGLTEEALKLLAHSSQLFPDDHDLKALSQQLKQGHNEAQPED